MAMSRYLWCPKEGTLNLHYTSEQGCWKHWKLRLISRICQIPDTAPLHESNAGPKIAWPKYSTKYKYHNWPSSRLNTLISSPTVPSPSNASPVLILRPSPVILLVSDVGLELEMDPSGAGGTRELLLLRPFLALAGGVPSGNSILGDTPSPTWVLKCTD